MSVQLKNQGVALGAFLEQVAGGDKGRVFELRTSRMTVGRSPDCDIVVDMEGVSRVHALLVNSEGAWFIRDNNSKNGLFINGKQLKESWLENGDVVQIGTFAFRFDAGPALDAPSSENLPTAGELGGGLELGLAGNSALDAVSVGGSKPKKAGPNRRVMIYVGVLLLAGAFMFMGGESPKPTATETPKEESADGKLARDFKTAEKPEFEIGTKQAIPLGMEDPLLKRAEQEMAKLDWTNTSLREAEQFFRRGQREYLNKNYHRAIDSFQTALSLYGGHLLAERYLRRAVYEVEIEAKNHMAMGVQYYESLQYSRAIHHFNEAMALMIHRPNEAMIKEAGRYIKQAELRLQAAELFP